MPLLSHSEAPPKGWRYFEPALNWRLPTHNLPYDLTVAEIQAVRANNPGAALDPSYEACSDALDTYMCALLGHNPRWCTPGSGGTSATAPSPRPASSKRCTSCGRRRQQ